MYIDYKKIQNLVIEELINNSKLSFDLLISNLNQNELLNIIIDNMEVKESNLTGVYDIYLFRKRLGFVINKNGYKTCDKYFLLKQFIVNNKQGYYSLMDTILNLNCYNLNDTDYKKISLKLYLREIVDVPKTNDKIKLLKIKKEVYYLKTIIGMYGNEEYYKVEDTTSCNDFYEVSTQVNKSINIKSSDLKGIALKMINYNERYKKALRKSFK